MGWRWQRVYIPTNATFIHYLNDAGGGRVEMKIFTNFHRRKIKAKRQQGDANSKKWKTKYKEE
jgi:hypothetical protein